MAGLLSVHLLFNQSLLHSHDYPTLLIIGLNSNFLLACLCPSCWFPGNWWASLTLIPPVNGSLLLPKQQRLPHPACCLPHTVRCCSRTLLQMCKILYQIRHWWLLLSWGSSVLRLGNCKTRRLAGYSPMYDLNLQFNGTCFRSSMIYHGE